MKTHYAPWRIAFAGWGVAALVLYHPNLNMMKASQMGCVDYGTVSSDYQAEVVEASV